MPINKLHPDYPEYIRKCKELAQCGQEESEKVKPSGGQDGPLGAVHKKYAKQLKALQKEYNYLFAEE